jgi:glycyl-tRNA synthetase beta chain
LGVSVEEATQVRTSDSSTTRYQTFFKQRAAVDLTFRTTIIDGIDAPVDGVVADLITFFHDRLTVYFREQGFRHDRVAAALTEGADDFVLVEKKLRALSSFLDTAEGQNLSAAYKRASNILKAEEKKTGLPDADPDPSLFEQGEEGALHAALETAEAKAQSAIAEEDFASAMAALSAVRAPLDTYFDAVTVNAEDSAVRANRLAQLLRFRNVVTQVADFDRLEG